MSFMKVILLFQFIVLQLCNAVTDEKHVKEENNIQVESAQIFSRVPYNNATQVQLSANSPMHYEKQSSLVSTILSLSNNVSQKEEQDSTQSNNSNSYALEYEPENTTSMIPVRNQRSPNHSPMLHLRDPVCNLKPLQYSVPRPRNQFLSNIKNTLQLPTIPKDLSPHTFNPPTYQRDPIKPISCKPSLPYSPTHRKPPSKPKYVDSILYKPQPTFKTPLYQPQQSQPRYDRYTPNYKPISVTPRPTYKYNLKPHVQYVNPTPKYYPILNYQHPKYNLPKNTQQKYQKTESNIPPYTQAKNIHYIPTNNIKHGMKTPNYNLPLYIKNKSYQQHILDCQRTQHYHPQPKHNIPVISNQPLRYRHTAYSYLPKIVQPSVCPSKKNPYVSNYYIKPQQKPQKTYFTKPIHQYLSNTQKTVNTQMAALTPMPQHQPPSLVYKKIPSYENVPLLDTRTYLNSHHIQTPYIPQYKRTPHYLKYPSTSAFKLENSSSTSSKEKKCRMKCKHDNHCAKICHNCKKFPNTFYTFGTIKKQS